MDKLFEIELSFVSKLAEESNVAEENSEKKRRILGEIGKALDENRITEAAVVSNMASIPRFQAEGRGKGDVSTNEKKSVGKYLGEQP